MSRTIYASPRFGFFTAIAVVIGALFVEAIAAGMTELVFFFGAFFGSGVWAGESWQFAAALSIATKFVACGTVTAIVLRRSHESWRSLGRMTFTPLTLIVAFVPIVLACVIFLSEIDNLVRAFLPSGLPDPLHLAPAIDRMLGSGWAGPALAVIVAPLTEEVLFRGLILRGLLGRWKPWGAIVVSAVLFAATHLNLGQLPIAMGLGLVLGWIYVRTRSLGLCVLGHALSNLMSYFTWAVPWEIDGFNHVPNTTGDVFHPWWFDSLGVALFAAGIWLVHRLAPPATPWEIARAPEPASLEPPLLEPPFLRAVPNANGSCQTANPAETSPSMSAELASLVTSLAQRARAASLVLATAPTAAKDAALAKLADLIDASHAALLAANTQDLASPEAAALATAGRERLTLTPAKLTHLAQSVREVIALPDPIGTELEAWTRPNGLRIRKLRVPIGVIGIIYEARPNVTVDCAILCLKSGNASILRGGKECFHTNTALAALISQALGAAGLPADAVQLIPTTDRAALNTLLKLDTLIHCIIPRGGESLIRYVAANSTIPVIKHYTGVCFVYIDREADPNLAGNILVNSKTQRPGVCNAAEQLLIHADVAESLLPRLASALIEKNVQLRCDAASAAILAHEKIAHIAATPTDFTAEYLDLIMAVRVVDSLDTAIATINRDGSAHSDVIVTRDEAAARRFQSSVDSAAVFWNASTRFNDGFEFGYGAEIGISTDRLHARGPMGLRELCTYKFVIDGTGQIRG